MGSPDLRERTRQAVRAEISNAAMRLFLDQGFEATTVDQIADQVGVSRRSLFRYFSSKEEIAVAGLQLRGGPVLRALQARPPLEDPWEALRAAAFQSQGLDPSIAPEEMLSVTRFLQSTPALQGARLQKQKQWQDLLVPEMASRLRAGTSTTSQALAPDADLRARAIVATAVACLDAAVDLWTQRGGQDNVLELFEEMISAVRT